MMEYSSGRDGIGRSTLRRLGGCEPGKSLSHVYTGAEDPFEKVADFLEALGHRADVEL